MLNLESYVDKYVNIKCKNGKHYAKYYVSDYFYAADNFDPEEDSIGISKDEHYSGGIMLYESEIESIEICD